jgi:hypothetical protein
LPPFCFAPLGLLAGSVTISIDIDRVVDRIDSRIGGIFMEPIGCDRGGVKFNPRGIGRFLVLCGASGRSACRETGAALPSISNRL